MDAEEPAPLVHTQARILPKSLKSFGSVYVHEWGTLKPIILKDYTIQNNLENGIYVEGAAEVTLLNCAIQENGEHGVVLYDMPNIAFTNCTITGNQYGISVLYMSWLAGEARPVDTLPFAGDFARYMHAITGSNNKIYGNRLEDLVPGEGWPAGFR